MKEITFLSLPFEAGTLAHGEILALIEKNGRKGIDFILLPETCTGPAFMHEPGDAFLTGISELAHHFNTHICCPVGIKGANGERFNSALLYGRDGSLLARYDKVYPYWGEFDLVPPATPGKKAVVVNTDVGKVGLAICFDINFPVLWDAMAQQDADFVLWTSAYSAGASLAAPPITHHLAIITCSSYPDCALIDIDGRETAYHFISEDASPAYEMRWDADKVICHTDNNSEKVALLTKEHPAVTVTRYRRENWFMLQSREAAVSAKALVKAYGIETLREYKTRSMREIDAMRS